MLLLPFLAPGLAHIVLAGSLAIVLFAFALYPLLIGVLARWWGRPTLRGDELPSVTVLFAAHDEAVVIGAKLANFRRLDYPEDRLRMVIVSDGSTDGTDELVLAARDARVKLVRQEKRRGKAAALALGLEKARGDVVVFTDANVLFEGRAVRNLVRHFADPRVGAVTGTVRLVDRKPGYAPSEGLYYRFERFIQRAESRFESVVGVDGALYAARREAVRPPPDDAIVEDLIISQDLARRGFRVLYDPEALAFEDAAPTVAQEFHRKSRVAMGAFQAVARGLAIPGLSTPRLFFSTVGHKLCRWAAPWALLGALFASAALARASVALAALLAAQLAFYGMALAGILVQRVRAVRACAVPTYFVLMNAAFVWGLVRLLRGEGLGTWQSVERHVVATDVAEAA